MSQPLTHHQSYIIQCCAEYDRTTQAWIWRFRVKDVRTGEAQGFASLEEALAFIEGQLYQPIGGLL